jgi:hypothetical protein
MKNLRTMPKSLITALAIALTGVVAFAFSSAPQTPPAAAKKVNHYIGAAKCKNCHSAPENGDQYGCWAKTKHAEAFKTLAGDEAKKLGAAKGIADPQKDEKCFKCHTTGFGLAEDQFKKGFDKSNVQCEACHGPGEAHMAARMAAGAAADPKVRVTIPEGEIALNGNPKFCQGCHNAESPSFKPFCYHERLEKIAHYDPRGTRKPTTPLKSCPCDDTCECKKGPCKDLPKK